LKEVERPMLWRDPFALMTSQLTRPSSLVPALDVAVSEDDVVLTMDVPGFRSDELSIEVEDRFLTVRGERKRPEASDGTSYVHVERPFGSFERRITVPGGVDLDRITASLHDGVLSLIVPKPERLKPRAITIDGGTAQRQLETATA
jgi:HSP20 family protein